MPYLTATAIRESVAGPSGPAPKLSREYPGYDHGLRVTLADGAEVEYNGDTHDADVAYGALSIFDEASNEPAIIYSAQAWLTVERVDYSEARPAAAAA